MRLSFRLISLLVLALLLGIVGIVAGAYQIGIPVSAAGMAAKNVCSAMFVSGRKLEDVIEHDILPASVIMQLARINADTNLKQVSASLPGTSERHAIYRKKLGCMVLGPGELPPPPGIDRAPWPQDDRHHDSRAVETIQPNLPWPRGSGPAETNWPANIKASSLQASISAAFKTPHVSSTSPDRGDLAGSRSGPNTRAVLVVHQGRLLAERYGKGFDLNTPQLGWSMAKSLLSVLTWNYFADHDAKLDLPVAQVIQRVPRPNWVGRWAGDERAGITVRHLLMMRDGLDHLDSYQPWSEVPRMLWSVPDIAAFAGSAPVVNKPGSDWRYSSAVSNLLSGVLRDQFSSDREYWQYPAKAIFEPLGMDSAILETDASGTFIASSYLWATPRDWARLGWTMLNDGQWLGEQVFPKGWLELARQSTTLADGTRSPYGAHIWQTHDSSRLQCASEARLPDDGILLSGHWGQIVGIFPTQQTVIVRMGWTVDRSQWDKCAFLSDILGAIKPASG